MASPEIMISAEAAVEVEAHGQEPEQSRSRMSQIASPEIMTNAKAVVEVEVHGQEPKQSRSRTTQLAEYFRYDERRDKPSDVRTALLTVAVLMAAATYQAVLSPPGGIWQESKSDVNPIQVAGVSIMGTKAHISFDIFMFGNTLGFSFSLYMIDFLTRGFPLRLELGFTMFAIGLTYGSSLGIITPSGFMGSAFITLSVGFAFLLLPFLVRLLRDKMAPYKIGRSAS